MQNYARKAFYNCKTATLWRLFPLHRIADDFAYNLLQYKYLYSNIKVTDNKVSIIFYKLSFETVSQHSLP